MRVGIYIPKTLPEQKRKALFASIEQKMSVGARIQNRSDTDSCIILNPLVENFFTDNNADSLAENKRTHTCDAIIIAQHLNGDGAEADMTQEIAKFKAAYPQKLVALYYDLPSHERADQLKTGTVFNGMAKGADIVYAELPRDPKSLALGLKPHSRNRMLRSLLHAVRDKRIARGVRSPELFVPKTDKVLSIGNVTIDTDTWTLNLPGSIPVLNLTESHVKMIGALARYQGSYLPIDLLMREMYRDEIARAESKGYTYKTPEPKIIDVFCCRLKDVFATNGFGAIERLWGVGRYISHSAFIAQDVMTFNANAAKEYGFAYDPAAGVVTHPLSGTSLDFPASENRILEKLMETPGKIVRREALLTSANDDVKGVDVAMVKVRAKLGLLYPDIQNFGHLLIQTIHGRGYRLRPPAELEYMMDKARTTAFQGQARQSRHTPEGLRPAV